MPIDINHAGDPLLYAQAAYQSSGAPVYEDIRRYEDQMAQREYEQDRRYDLDVQQIALQNELARYRMGQEAAQFGAQLQSQNYNNQLDYALGAQQLAQRDEQLGVEAALQSEQQQQLTNRTQLSQLGQIARQQQQQKFELAMAERKSGEEWMRSATPRQRQQFVQRWEQTHGMPWTAPEEAMAEQDAKEQQDRVANIRRAFSNPFAPDQSLLPEGAEEWALQLTPKELMDASIKAQSEERQRQVLLQKEGEVDRKLQEEEAKAQQKEQIEAAKNATKTMRDSIAGEREYRQAQEEYNRDVQQYEADMKAFDAAKAAHAKMAASASRGGGAGGPAKPFTQTPPMKPVPPTPGLFADKIPAPTSPEEVDALLPGTRFIAPDGTIRVR